MSGRMAMGEVVRGGSRRGVSGCGETAMLNGDSATWNSLVVVVRTVGPDPERAQFDYKLLRLGEANVDGIDYCRPFTPTASQKCWPAGTGPLRHAPACRRGIRHGIPSDVKRNEP